VPIEYRIDHSRRLVLARGTAAVTDADIFGYQREVWSRPDVAGYDELVDMRETKSIAFVSASRLRELAAVSAAIDPAERPSKLAVVAPQDLAFGLGRTY